MKLYSIGEHEVRWKLFVYFDFQFSKLKKK